MNTKSLTITTLAALFSLNCGNSGGDGDGDGDSDGDPCASTERYMELAEGKAWTFAVTDVAMGTTQTKTQTIGALEDVGDMKAGVQAFRVTTVKTGGTVTSWQEDTGSAIRRHRERDEAGGTQVDEFYDAHKLRVDEAVDRIAVGSEFTESYSEIVTDLQTNEMSTTAKTETWTIEADDDIVSVPAGSFCALRIRRISVAMTGGSMKTYWFSRGVGKVGEESAGRIEELMSYQ